jgi:hypothetical protein
VILGVVLGKLLKRAAETGTFEPPFEGSLVEVHGFDNVASRTTPRAASLIVNSNETW